MNTNTLKKEKCYISTVYITILIHTEIFFTATLIIFSFPSSNALTMMNTFLISFLAVSLSLNTAHPNLCIYAKFIQYVINLTCSRSQLFMYLFILLDMNRDGVMVTVVV